jgi:hypothetical protein
VPTNDLPSPPSRPPFHQPSSRPSRQPSRQLFHPPLLQPFHATRTLDPLVMRLRARIQRVLSGLDQMIATMPVTPGGMRTSHLVLHRQRWAWFHAAVEYIDPLDLAYYEDAGIGIRDVLTRTERSIGAFDRPAENRFSALYDEADAALPADILTAIDSIQRNYPVIGSTAASPTPSPDPSSPDPSPTGGPHR